MKNRITRLSSNDAAPAAEPTSRIGGILGLVAIALLALAFPADAQWTPWLDRDNPSGKGDFETLSDFRRTREVPCEMPRNIQCRTLDGRDFRAAGQVYSCTPQKGGICVNADQPDGADCLDYEVRFQCGPDLGVTAGPRPFVEFGCGRFQSLRTQVPLNITGGADPYTCSGPAANFPLEVAGDRCVGLGPGLGIHTFTVTDSAGDSESVTVEIQDVFTPIVSVDCSAGAATVSAESINDGPMTFRWQPGDLEGPTQAPGPDTYEVVVTDAVGCFRVVEVVIPSPPC